MAEVLKGTKKSSLNAKKTIPVKKPAIKSTSPQLAADDVAAARTYIENFWVNLERYQPKDQDSLIGLPNRYLVPAHDPKSSFNFDEMYYWDSYFMVQGMLSDSSKKSLVLGMLDNLFSLLQRYNLIPNASRTYLTGRSQPPLLTSFIFDVYEAYGLDKRWLAKAIAHAQLEYQTVWMGQKQPFWHQVHKGLSRYYDINSLHDLAETESGWDMTTRFDRRCMDFLPIDLNAYLYKYEADFARAAHIMGQLDEQVAWEQKAEARKKQIDTLMWNSKEELYFDYDYRKKKLGTVASLASYVPLWAGMVDKDKAEALVRSLKRFIAPGGLLTTDESRLKNARPQNMPTQWASPNGWAPLHFFVVQGFEKYNYSKLAEQIARRWLLTNTNWYNQHFEFLEKYNMLHPHKPPTEGVYPSQTGFGWTNAIFERFCHDYIDKADHND